MEEPSTATGDPAGGSEDWVLLNDRAAGRGADEGRQSAGQQGNDADDEEQGEEVPPSADDLQELSRNLAQVPRSLQQRMTTGEGLPLVSFLHVGEGPAASTIPVHTPVLLARCPYFCAMMSSSLAEAHSATAEFHLPTLTPRGVRAVVDFLYSARLRVAPHSVVHVLHAAKFLQVAGAEEACARYVTANVCRLDTGNVLQLLESALLLGSQPLERELAAFIAENMQAVMRHVAADGLFGTVSPQQLLTLLRRDDLAVAEDSLYAFVEAWAQERGTSEEEAAQVFSHVSYAAMSSDALQHLQSRALPRGVSARWLQQALECKADPGLLPSTPPAQRIRVPLPPLVIFGRRRFGSSQMLQLQLMGGAVWEGNVLDLTATDSYGLVEDPRGALNASSSFSVEAWVCPSYMDRPTPEGPIVSRHGQGSGWELRMGQQAVEMMVTLSKGGTTWHELAACSADIQLGSWVHVAGTYDGKQLAVYVNGRCSTRRRPNWNNQWCQNQPEGAAPAHFSGVVVNLGRNAQWPERKLVCKLTGVRITTDHVIQQRDFLPLAL